MSETRNDARIKKLLLNSVTSLLSQAVTMICGFILPRLILTHFGSDVNGLTASITQFLSFITFLEMGLGAVVKSNLYKPLSEKDDLGISKIVISSNRFFRKIAILLVAYTLFLAFFFPYITSGSSFDHLYSASLVIIISISSFAQYYFGITYQFLLNADQKSYIPSLFGIVTLILNTGLSAILMSMGASIHIVKLGTSLVYLIRPLGLNIYVHKHYHLNEKLKLDEEPIKQKWNGIIQHIAYVIHNNTDVTVLTLFSSLNNISVYTVYHNITFGIQSIITGVSVGLSAMVGNVLYSETIAVLKTTFRRIEWLFHSVTVMMFTVTGLLIVPFVQVYTEGVDDTNYIVPTFAIILTIAQATYSIRIPYETLVTAAGHYKQTQVSAIVEAFLNIVISVAAVWRFGLVGVAIGTLVAMGYRTIYFVCYLTENIIEYELRDFIKFILTDIIQICLMVTAYNLLLRHPSVSWTGWFILAAKTFSICLVICLVMNSIFYKEQVFGLTNYIKKKFHM